MFTKFILYISLLSLLLYPKISAAQNSFVRTVEIAGNTPPFLFPVVSNLQEEENGQSSFIITDYLQTNGLHFVGLASDGNIEYTYFVNPEENIQFRLDYGISGNNRLVTYIIKPILYDAHAELLVVNFETGTSWRKQLTEGDYIAKSSGFTRSGKVYSGHYMGLGSNGDKAGIVLFDKTTGNEEWNYYYKKDSTHADKEIYYNGPIKELSDGSFIAQLSISYENIDLFDEPPSPLRVTELLHLDAEGNIIKSVGINGNFNKLFGSDMVVDAEDNIYLSFGNSLEGTHGIIMKFDKDFNIIWAKKLVVENFPFRTLNIIAKPDGNIIFSHSTYGDLPIITGEISADGVLLWYRGYSFFSPRISIGSDNSIYFTSPEKYLEDGSSESAIVVAKTDPEGNIEACPQFGACLSLENVEFNFLPAEWSKEEAPPLPDLAVTVGTAFFESEPHCDTPLPPRADFVLSDTICQYECLSPDSTFNRFAHQIEWHITGASTDTIITDATFTWCFDIPGYYEVSQEVWLLGCSEYFVQDLVVLPDNLVISLGEDRILCEGSPFELKVESNRPLQTYLWQDSSTQTSISIVAEGTFSVTTTDGYCLAKDSVYLQFLEEVLGEELLTLPNDTIICKDNFPYILQPSSFYTQSFYLNNNSQPKSDFLLNTPDTYNVSMNLEGCLIEQNFVLQSSSCYIPIFIPNVFSPNYDGINDFIEPLGVGFIGVKLEVFDRWGNLLYLTKGPSFQWNGKSNEKELSPGVYVLVFHYKNQKSGKIAVISQEVMLMR